LWVSISIRGPALPLREKAAHQKEGAVIIVPADLALVHGLGISSAMDRQGRRLRQTTTTPGNRQTLININACRHANGRNSRSEEHGTIAASLNPTGP
jgi:hypothetical protein